MNDLEILTLFGTMLVLSAVPGPSDFAVVAQTLASGFKAAVGMIVGIIIADFALILLAIYGLAAAAVGFERVFLSLKVAGAAYLLWLGVRTFTAAPSMVTVNALPKSAFASFCSGFLITLGDPKALLFYLSLFPAFVDLTALRPTDTLLIMLIAALTIGGVKGLYAYLAKRSLRFFANIASRRKLNRIAGMVLVLTSGWLVCSSLQGYS